MSFTSVVGRALTRRSMQQRWGEIDDMSGRKSLNSGTGGRAAAVEYHLNNMSDVKLSCRRRPSLTSERTLATLPEHQGLQTHHGLARADSWGPGSFDLLEVTAGSGKGKPGLQRQSRRKRTTEPTEIDTKYITVANVPGELYDLNYDHEVPEMDVECRNLEEEEHEVPEATDAAGCDGSGYGSLQDMEINVSCECCGLSEEYTLGYVERAKSEFGGQWVCGLCAEAVLMELHRLGGFGAVPIGVAVAAHMEPCRAARTPPASDVAVPHAVCRLLRRHLSTPSPRGKPAVSSAHISRSASCLPAFP